MALTERDEYLHAPPGDVDGEHLWSDNFWFSVVDREADVDGTRAPRSGYCKGACQVVAQQRSLRRSPRGLCHMLRHFGLCHFLKSAPP